MAKGLLYAAAFLATFGIAKNALSQADSTNISNGYTIQKHEVKIENKIVPLNPVELSTNPQGENDKFTHYTFSDQKACVWYLTDLVVREREGYLSDSVRIAKDYQTELKEITNTKNKKISQLEKSLKELQSEKLPQKLDALKEQIKTLKDQNKEYETQLKQYEKKQ